MHRVTTSHDEQVFAFTREKDDEKVFVLLNLSDQPLEVDLMGTLYQGAYTELFSGEQYVFTDEEVWELEPWAYKVFVK